MQNESKRNKNEDISPKNFFGDDRPLPHSPDLEKAVIGAMLIDEPCIDEAIERFGEAKVFYSPENQKIYDTIISLREKGLQIDHITVSKSLSDQKILDRVGGDVYLAELQNFVSTTAHMETWCKFVHEQAVLRQLISACATSAKKCFDTDREVSEILDDVETSILSARDFGARQTFKDMRILMNSAMNYLQALKNKDESVTGISTGFPQFDNKITGLKKGEMIVLAARPSVGKTSFALNIISNVALKVNPARVVLFSLEMTAEQIARRLLCCESGVSEKEYVRNPTGIQFSKITKAKNTIEKAPIYIDPTGGLSVMELRAKARRIKSQKKINLIVIDYLQLMHADTPNKNETRQTEVSLISGGIKSLAKELDIPILVLAQLNRQAEMQRDGRPRLSNLRESGAIEQDADIVAFLHRNMDEAKTATPEQKKDGLKSELIIAKNRNGEPGIIDLWFYPEIMKFGCVEEKYKNVDANI